MVGVLRETRMVGVNGSASFQYIIHLLHIYLSINYQRIPFGAYRIDDVASGNLRNSICHKILVFSIAVDKI